jgi:hypothetical protein
MIQQRMRNMRIQGTNRYVFNRRTDTDNIHGHVLDIPRLKQSFSKVTREQEKQPIHPCAAFWRTKPLTELRQRVGGGTSEKSMNDLAEELEQTDVTVVTSMVLLMDFMLICQKIEQHINQNSIF